MIETREAVKNLDEILSVKGLNGIYVGPSDLSLSMGKPPTLDPTDKDVLDGHRQTIAKTTRKPGLIAGVHTDGPKTPPSASRRAISSAPSSTTCACWPWPPSRHPRNPRPGRRGKSEDVLRKS